MTIGELAAAIGVSQPGITRTAGLLEKQGLLKVAASDADQRRRVVTLTKDGQALIDLSKARVWPRIERSVRDLCQTCPDPCLTS